VSPVANTPTVALTRPIVVEDRTFDFGGTFYACPKGMPGLICRGRARVFNASFTRLDGPSAPCVTVDRGYRAHLSFITATLGQFGICVSNSEATRIVDCDACYNDLDGGKEPEGNVGTVWERGYYCHNGTSLTQKGDGIDSAFGGSGTSYLGPECDDNDGCGIVYKTAPLRPDGTGTPASGYQTDVEIAHVKCRRNLYGLSIEGQQEVTTSPADTDLRPMAARISIIGGIFNDNVTDGITNWGRDWTAIGTQTNGNGRAGFKVGGTARDWSMVAPIALGNGRLPLGSNADAPIGSTGQRAPDIWVLGQRGRIVAPITRGKTSRDVRSDSDVSALTAAGRYGIWFTKDADDVDVTLHNGAHHVAASIKHDATGTIRVDGVVL
jgi:hypothetical protein